MRERTIDQTQKLVPMSDSHTISQAGRARFLAACLVTVLAAGFPVGVAAQEEDAAIDSESLRLEGLELEREWAEDRATSGIPHKALACNTTNNKYCHGLYHELIVWVRHHRNGEVEIRPTAAVQSIASQSCPLYQGSKILIQAGEPYADRLLNQMTVAKVLGERFRLDWVQGTSGYCEIKYIIVPY